MAVSRFTPDGTVVALGLSARMAAVLVEAPDGSRRIERYDPATGALQGAMPVPDGVADQLDVAGTTIIYRDGRDIWLLDGTSGQQERIARARATPIGLSIEGSRVAWAEDLGDRAAVRAISLPPAP